MTSNWLLGISSAIIGHHHDERRLCPDGAIKPSNHQNLFENS
ncbi:MAG TPA: hypothetical protein VKA91_01830 [Nitrososphaeraceae archaeon]|nr:hypothetical protein [Nitrososphaeraceae archaeon]